MCSMNETVKRSHLPSNETIYEKSIYWAIFMSRIQNYKSILIDELASDISDTKEIDYDIDNTSPANDGQQIEKNNNFQGSSGDGELDVNSLLKKNIPIEERKRKWEESGMDRFNINAVTEKVGSWLKKSKLICLPSNSSTENAQIVHFENHQMHFDSDESIKSTDTAKYILSNRKHRTASCTTMTIKKFRYIKGRAHELERKYDFLENLGPRHNLNEVHPKICTGHASRKSNGPKKTSDGGLNYRNIDTTIPERKLTRVTRRRKKRSDMLRKRLYSSSSSSCSSHSCTLSHGKSKYRRYRRNYKKKTHVELPNRNTPSRESIFKSKANRINLQTLQNETNSQPENIVYLQVNSGNIRCQLKPLIENNPMHLKLFKRKLVVKCKKHLFENLARSPEIEVGSTSRGSARKFAVYTPETKSQHSENITGRFLSVTEDLLGKVIGKKALLRYTTFNPQKLPLEVDSRSAVYFELPAEYESSESCNTSDEDVLNMFGKVGKVIVELTTTQSHIQI